MISFLRGKILKKRKNYLIIDVNGVGYQVFVNPAFLADFEKEAGVEIYIHSHIKEDAFDLYGFKNLEELEIFELLLSISGVGPKSALGVLAIATVEDIKNSIHQGDPGLLQKVSGIGKKTAERVVLELKGKIPFVEDSGAGSDFISSNIGSDEIDALVALGYSSSQAREALSKIDKNIKDSGERIRQALKQMSS